MNYKNNFIDFNENKLQRFKDYNLWYAYFPSTNVWCITDNENFNMASVSYFNADYKRIDQCIDMFKNHK